MVRSAVGVSRSRSPRRRVLRRGQPVRAVGSELELAHGHQAGGVGVDREGPARDRRRRRCARGRARTPARRLRSRVRCWTAPRAQVCSSTTPEATAKAPDASPWSCQPVSVPSGHEISQTSRRASPARRAQVRLAALGEQRGEVRVEGVAAGGPPQLGQRHGGRAGVERRGRKRSCRVPRVGAGAWTSPREAGTGTGGLSSDGLSGSSRRSGPATTARDDAPRGRRDRPTRAHSRRAAGEHVTRTSAMKTGSQAD